MRRWRLRIEPAEEKAGVGKVREGAEGRERVDEAAGGGVGEVRRWRLRIEPAEEKAGVGEVRAGAESRERVDEAAGGGVGEVRRWRLRTWGRRWRPAWRQRSGGLDWMKSGV